MCTYSCMGRHLFLSAYGYQRILRSNLNLSCHSANSQQPIHLANTVGGVVLAEYAHDMLSRTVSAPSPPLVASTLLVHTRGASSVASLLIGPPLPPLSPWSHMSTVVSDRHEYS